jgi:hypothetical protein
MNSAWWRGIDGGKVTKVELTGGVLNVWYDIEDGLTDGMTRQLAKMATLGVVGAAMKSGLPFTELDTNGYYLGQPAVRMVYSYTKLREQGVFGPGWWEHVYSWADSGALAPAFQDK